VTWTTANYESGPKWAIFGHKLVTITKNGLFDHGFTPLYIVRGLKLLTTTAQLLKELRD